jgi:uncharacterized membrane protein HdeD (DUF308 family)
MVDTLSAQWWVVALRGGLAVVFGVLALLWPFAAIMALAILVGAYLILDGIAALYHAVARGAVPQPRWLLTFHGVLSLILGLMIALWPFAAVTAWVLLFGVWAVASGVALISTGWRLRAAVPHEWLMILAGVLSIIAGVLVVVMALVWTVEAELAFALLIGAYAVVIGAAQLVLGLRMRRRGKHRANSPAPAVETE